MWDLSIHFHKVATLYKCYSKSMYNEGVKRQQWDFLKVTMESCSVWEQEETRETVWDLRQNKDDKLETRKKEWSANWKKMVDKTHFCTRKGRCRPTLSEAPYKEASVGLFLTQIQTLEKIWTVADSVMVNWLGKNCFLFPSFLLPL